MGIAVNLRGGEVIEPGKSMKGRGLKPNPVGWDFAKKLSGHMSNKDGYQEANAEPPEHAPIITMDEVMVEVRRYLNGEGFELIPEPCGDVAGHNIYVTESIAHELALKPAHGFRYKKRVRPGEALYTSFKKTVVGMVNHFRASVEDKEFVRLVTGIGKALVDRPKDGRTDLYQYALGQGQPSLKRSLSGQRDVYKYVPPKDWFPEAVQKLTANDLLGGMLPEPEQRVFELCLGRVLLGRPGTKTMEGVVPNIPFATYCTLVGFRGGEGKSTLLDGYLKPTFEMLGFNVGIINPEANRFGRQWVVSDIAISEDINNAGHEKLLVNDPVVKSVVSGASQVVLEEKGVQERPVTPVSLPFYCANNFDNTWLLKADAGMLRRYNALRCYSEQQLRTLYGSGWKNYRPRERWQTLSQELGVTVYTLGAWLLRLSLDYFMEVAGVKPEDGVMHWDWRNCRLEEELAELRSQLAIDTSMSHTEDMMDSIELATVLAIKTVDERYRTRLLDKLEEVPLMTKALHTCVDIWRHSEELPDSLQRLVMSEVCPTARVSWDNQTDRLMNDISVAENQSVVWKRIISALTVKDKGWQYRQSLSSYTSLWSLRRSTFRALYDSISDDDFAQIPDLTFTFLKELGEALTATMNISLNRKAVKSRR